MFLLITDGTLYVNNHFLCCAEAGNGRRNLPVGRYSVATQYSHAHGQDLPNVNEIGWVGANPECDIILGRVRAGNGLIPCSTFLGSLQHKLEAAEDIGQHVTLEIR